MISKFKGYLPSLLHTSKSARDIFLLIIILSIDYNWIDAEGVLTCSYFTIKF